MPQSAEDATRFTSTTPHAPFFHKREALKNPRSRTSGPPGETPQEKVRRLRAAAEKARQAQISNVDRWIARGRVWADTAHTITTTALIAATFVAGGVTIYAVTDMIMYNRKKKAQFFEEQNAKLQLAVDTARKAIQDGTATEAQIQLVKVEDEHQASIQSQSQKHSLFSKGKKWLFSGLKDEEADATNSSNFLNSERNLENRGNTDAITTRAKQAFEHERQATRPEVTKNSVREIVTESESQEEKIQKTPGWISWILRR